MSALFILIAVLLAWYGGVRWCARSQSEEQQKSTSIDYFRGLNFLLNEEPDEALDTFINSLEVTPDTLSTHLALGTLMRKRGEVERAIRIHQNLLSRPLLSQTQLHQAQMELARDFMAAGLFDRAERLMLDLVDMSEVHRNDAAKHLIEIYRDEQEWEKAIRAASLLKPRRFGFRASPLPVEQGHFSCELAEQAFRKGDLLEVRRNVRMALKFDKGSVRANLILGRLELQQGNYKGALKQFDKIVGQDPDYLPEVVADICNCYQKLNKQSELIHHLRSLYDKSPSNTLLLALADQIRKVEGLDMAEAFLGKQLANSPSLKGLVRLLDWQLSEASDCDKTAKMLKDLLQKLQNSRPTHRCSSCGFSGRHIHWLCPTCKSWGTVKPVRGIEGE